MEESFKVKHLIISSRVPYIVNSVTNERIRIGKHDLATLILLCKNAGNIVPKEDLLSYAWSGKIVTEGSLVQSIRIIRNILGDNGKEQKILKTVSKVGYILDPESVQKSNFDVETKKLETKKENIKIQFKSEKKTVKELIFNLVSIFVFFFLLFVAVSITLRDSAKSKNIILYESDKLVVYSNNSQNEELKFSYEEVEGIVNDFCDISFIYVFIGEKISYSVIKPGAMIYNKIIIANDGFESFSIVEDIRNEFC